MARELLIDSEKRHRGGPVIRAAMRVALDDAPTIVLFGPSGSGKTTVLRQLAGLDRPGRGRIEFDGETWFDGASGRHVETQQRRVGILFQDYALFPHLSVRANVAFGLRRVPRDEAERRVDALLERFGLAALASRKPDAISGGQKQRVALARTLAPEPRLLLLDEPLSALDAPTRDALRGELRSMLRELRIPAIVVTHDRTEALALGDLVAVIVDGSIRQSGRVADVFSHPADLDVARTVGIETVAEATIVARDQGLVRLRVGTAEVTAVDPGEGGDRVFLCLRGDEVAIERGGEPASSARNHLPATIAAIAEEGPLVRVVLDAGFELVALITRPAALELRLREGDRVVATVKATSVRVVPR